MPGNCLRDPKMVPGSPGPVALLVSHECWEIVDFVIGCQLDPSAPAFHRASQQHYGHCPLSILRRTRVSLLE